MGYARDYMGNSEISKLQVITIKQEIAWKNIINRSVYYDFYHTWSYHSLEKCGEPILIVYERKADFIALPLIRRWESSFKSYLTSAYGYSGPVSNKMFKDCDVDLMEDFARELLLFLKNTGDSSVTIRLHPLIDQTRLLDHLGGEIKDGKSVAIDLSISIEEQRRGYSANLRNQISKLRRKGYYVKEGASNDIGTFASIYWENMKRIGSDDVYLFDEQYFSESMAAEDFEAKLFFVFSGTEPVCASLVTFTNGVIQGFLLGTRTHYLPESPAKLLIDQISVVGREQGMKYYNLGGGLNFEEDQLFKWKTRFSRLCFRSQKWTYSMVLASSTV